MRVATDFKNSKKFEFTPEKGVEKLQEAIAKLFQNSAVLVRDRVTFVSFDTAAEKEAFEAYVSKEIKGAFLAIPEVLLGNGEKTHDIPDMSSGVREVTLPGMGKLKISE